MGDPVDITYQNGVESTLTVAGVFDDASLGSSWYFSIAELEGVSDQPARDQFVLARIADDVTDLVDARQTINEALRDFPQAKVQDNSEFRAEQEGQINQLLVVITTLLGMAIVISFLGIAITLALSVFERTREIGLLCAVGMNRRQLRRAVRWEAVIVAVFGVVVGVTIGLLMGVALSLAVPDNVIDGITLPWGTLIGVVVFAIVAAIVAALYPAYKASRMDVLQPSPPSETVRRHGTLTPWLSTSMISATTYSRSCASAISRRSPRCAPAAHRTSCRSASVTTTTPASCG